MKPKTCYWCGDYQKLQESAEGITAYAKPVTVILIPAYINTIIEGKRKWVRIGLYCPRCHKFEDAEFKPRKRTH